MIAPRPHVLVVDDHAVNRLLMSHAVWASGGDVVTADDGAEALERLASDRFDLVFMDIAMPVLDGIESTRRARALGVSLPIVAVTAQYSKEDLARLMSDGFDGLIPKPFDLSRIEDWVRRSGETRR